MPTGGVETTANRGKGIPNHDRDQSRIVVVLEIYRLCVVHAAFETDPLPSSVSRPTSLCSGHKTRRPSARCAHPSASLLYLHARSPAWRSGGHSSCALSGSNRIEGVPSAALRAHPFFATFMTSLSVAKAGSSRSAKNAGRTPRSHATCSIIARAHPSSILIERVNSTVNAANSDPPSEPVQCPSSNCSSETQFQLLAVPSTCIACQCAACRPVRASTEHLFFAGLCKPALNLLLSLEEKLRGVARQA
eukprot:scaffold29169_cov38-Tisochrysis_lutea.AAC.2